MRSRAIVVAAVLSSAVVTGGWLLQHGFSGAGGTVSRARLFDEVFTHLSRYYVDSLGASDLYDRAVDGMLRELHDPHTTFLAAERLSRLNESTSGNYGGLGVQIDVRDGWIIVVAPFAGGPAERAGMETGDRIVEIEGKSTRGWTSDEAFRAVRGPPGTKVSLVIEKVGTHERIPLTLERREIHRSAVRRSLLLGDGVGYVELAIFSDSTARELQRAIDSLMNVGAKSMIVDLRNNPGGLLTQGVGVADLFLDSGQEIVEMRGRVGEANRNIVDGARQRWPALPLVALINEGSASASEIVAGALQDHDRALVIGRTSFGKGSAQTIYPIVGGGALKLTTALWYTPLGRSINKVMAASEDDEAGAEADTVQTPRKTFKTEGGRTVFGGGGITPDVVSADTATPPADIALQGALGVKVPIFRDAMTNYALALKASGGLPSPTFTVTPEMRDELWRRMQSRGISIPRSVYADATPLVSRLLGYEIARYVFGPIAQARRQLADDSMVRLASDALRGARSQQDLFARASRYSPPPARSE
jgi:carboxyl-terminal processing protease